MFAASLVLLVSGCKKDKENSAVVEEVPAAAPKETDTSATLAEEPNLQQVGKDKPGSAKNTFHPGKGKDKNAGTPSAAASEAGFSDAGHFVVQVAIFKSKRQAAALVEKLSGQGYPAYVAEVADPVPQLSGTYHRVRIGKFLKIGDARAFGDNTLKPLGYDYWVDNTKNDAVGGMGSGSEPVSSTPAAPAGESPATEAPAPRKGKKAKTAVAEPSAPPGGTWGAPNAGEPVQPNSAEPATPSADSWSGPKTESQPAKTASPAELPGTNPAPAAPSEPASPAASTAPAAPAPSAKAPGQPAKADSGKVNLDEW
jgi:hypothetical protein